MRVLKDATTLCIILVVFVLGKDAKLTKFTKDFNMEPTLQQEAEKCTEAIIDLWWVVVKELKIKELFRYMKKKLKMILYFVR